MNVIRSLLVSASICASTGSASAITLSDDFELAISGKLVSDYRVAGISQTLGNPAVQADATLMHSTGFYGGIAASNVDFGTKTRMERDYYAGFMHQFNEDVGINLIYLEYDYPKDSMFNYADYLAIINAYGVEVGFKYANKIKPYGDDRMWTWVKYTAELPYELKADARIARYDYKDDVLISASGKVRSSNYDWEIGVSRSAFGLEWRLAYVDTDLSAGECSNYFGYDDICSATLVTSVSKAF